MSKKQILIGNSTVLKEVNRVRLLNELWSGGPRSRADLSKKTSLDAKTITNICNELLDQKLIASDKIVISGRGRPAEILKLNPEAMYSVGVDVGASHVNAIVVDFSGNVVGQKSCNFKPIKSLDFVLKKIEAIAIQLLSDFKGKNKIKGIGLSFPGLLDRENGKIIDSVNFNKVSNYEIVAHVERQMNLPVFLDESSRLMALGELWFGDHANNDNFITIDLGYGIGMGIVQNGLLYRGVNEISGEIGHIMINPKGQKCRCGKNGCLETIASGKALENESSKFDLTSYGITSSGSRAIFEAADKGNKKAIKTLQKVGYSIGIAIANVITLMDPGFVIAGGGLVNAGKYIMGPLQEAVREYSLSSLRENPDVIQSKLGEDSCALGAAMIPIKEYFEIESIRL